MKSFKEYLLEFNREERELWKLGKEVAFNYEERMKGSVLRPHKDAIKEIAKKLDIKQSKAMKAISFYNEN